MLARSAIGAALLLAGICQATALTALINANERNCYYADVDGAGEKVGEYHLSKCNGRALHVTARVAVPVSVLTRTCHCSYSRPRDHARCGQQGTPMTDGCSVNIS